MTEIINQISPHTPSVVLTGPNLASEVALGLPSASVAASENKRAALMVQQVLSSDCLRVYTHNDVIGCELGGALKNVMAIALGMADGLHLGANAKASLLTRGLAELSRLGAAMGADPLTFSGLAGLGDLVATATSPLSRNRTFGERIARGESLADIEHSTTMVAEGVKTSAVVQTLAARVNIEMPITQTVVNVLGDEQTPRGAMLELMRREPRDERNDFQLVGNI